MRFSNGFEFSCYLVRSSTRHEQTTGQRPRQSNWYDMILDVFSWIYAVWISKICQLLLRLWAKGLFPSNSEVHLRATTILCAHFYWAWTNAIWNSKIHLKYSDGTKLLHRLRILQLSLSNWRSHCWVHNNILSITVWRFVTSSDFLMPS